jgi:DNA-binding transcriptional ArsR family regulator
MLANVMDSRLPFDGARRADSHTEVFDRMAFMGETTDVGVAELLSVLARRGHTGRLQINSDGEEVQVVLNGGKVTQVTSSHHSLRLGRVLVRMGVLREEDLNDAVRAQVAQQTAKPLGQILTARGLATQTDLARAAEEQATEVLSRVFGAHDGTFFFTGAPTGRVKPGLMALNAEGIVLEAARRADEIQALQRMAPTTDDVLTLDRAAMPIGNQLPDQAQRIIRILSMGPLSVGELVSQLGDDERTVLRAIVGLEERGIVTIRHGDRNDDVPFADAVIIVPRTVGELRRLIGTADQSVTGRWTPSVEEVRAAFPAGAQTVAEVTRLMRDVVGAFNAGLPLLAFAHFSDDYFRRLPPVADAEFAVFEELTEPLAEDQQQTFIELRDVRALNDDRVSGIATTSLLGEAPAQRVVIFVRSGHRYQIDAIVEPSQNRSTSTQTTMLRSTSLLMHHRHALRQVL